MNYNLATLLKLNLIEDIDYHFSRFILRKDERILSKQDLDTIEFGTALISRQISKGNICLSKNDLDLFRDEFGIYGKAIPSWDEMCRVFSGSAWCSTKGEKKPVVFDGSRFYLYRYWNYEHRLASRIVEMANEESRFSLRSDEAEKILFSIFGNEGEKSGHLKAAAGVFKNRFTVITGGPGTGKTTTIAKIVSVIWTLFPETKIKLAAPTGKAAARMNEALKGAVTQLGNEIEPEISEKLSELAGSSIHRLMGWTSKPGVFKHNEENPIVTDLLIVDEASMIDLALMSLMMDAVSEKASIILLGDKDQLTSVEAGNVLGDIYSASLKGSLKDSAVAELTKSYRFKDGSGIGELAKAVNQYLSEDELFSVFRKFDDGSVKFINSDKPGLKNEIEKYIIDGYSGIFRANNFEEAFDALDRFRILCTLRKGFNGVEEICRLSEDILRKNGFINDNGTWYHGRPVMILENNYDLELFNGECGIIFNVEGEKRAVFKSGGNSFKTFPVAILPKIETVYAMTVHKSQGSEYDSVLIILPEKETPILTKELIYTAVTRSKKGVVIIGDRKILNDSVKRSAVRNSGLADALNFLSKQ